MPIGLTSPHRGARTVQLQGRPQVRLVFSLGLWADGAGRITYPTEAGGDWRLPQSVSIPFPQRLFQKNEAASVGGGLERQRLCQERVCYFFRAFLDGVTVAFLPAIFFVKSGLYFLA